MHRQHQPRPLRNIAPASGARILLKLENENPTGSMKDRMALAMIEAAEKDGRLKPGGSVVEYTAGTTGVLALAGLRGQSAIRCTSSAPTRSRARSWITSRFSAAS